MHNIDNLTWSLSVQDTASRFGPDGQMPVRWLPAGSGLSLEDSARAIAASPAAKWSVRPDDEIELPWDAAWDRGRVVAGPDTTEGPQAPDGCGPAWESAAKILGSVGAQLAPPERVTDPDGPDSWTAAVLGIDHRAAEAVLRAFGLTPDGVRPLFFVSAGHPRPGGHPGSVIVPFDVSSRDTGCRGEVRLSQLLADHPHDPSPWGDDAPAAVWCSAADRIAALFGDDAQIVLRAVWRAAWEAAVAWLRADRARRDTQDAYDRAREQEVAARRAEASDRLERAEAEFRAAFDAAIACGAIDQAEPPPGFEDRAVERARRDGVL